MLFDGVDSDLFLTSFSNYANALSALYKMVAYRKKTRILIAVTSTMTLNPVGPHRMVSRPRHVRSEFYKAVA
jgi:hypothetical protein